MHPGQEILSEEAGLSDRQTLPHMLKEVTTECSLMIRAGMWQAGTRLDLPVELLVKFHRTFGELLIAGEPRLQQDSCNWLLLACCSFPWGF